ncbi:MAG: N-6 DNA methylase, partial [Pseudomonadota bacterium]
MSDTTRDALLGGRVMLEQPRARGLRAGLDAVLLAAAVPARAGDRVVEGGCGSGAAFLCLAARIAGISVTAVERDPAVAALAQANAVANGCAATIIEGDVAARGIGGRAGPARHGFANPPYWPGGTAPPDSLRAQATHEHGAALDDWAAFLSAAIEVGGSVTMILPAARFDAGAAALRAAGFGGVSLLPLAPRVGVAAKRVLLQATRGGRGPARVLPPFNVHGADGSFTA